MPRHDQVKPGRSICFALAALLTVLCCAPTSLAKFTLDVEVGWEQKFRAGKWTPLFITIQDSAPRQVVIEVYSPTDRRYALNIRQGLAIGPSPVTVPIYVPLSYRLDETNVTVRDARSGRRIDNLILSDFPAYSNRGGPQVIQPQELFILISGSSDGERMLQGQLRHQQVQTAFAPTPRLPLTPAGYDGIDLVLLNQPDLSRLNEEQQGALADWVRGGGLLVINPGVAPVPPAGPLVEILPARLGPVRPVALAPEVIQKAGLGARFAKLTGRDLLDAAPDSRTVPLFDADGPESVRRWVGMGQVMLLPVEVSSLLFDDSAKALAFWRAALKGVIDIPVAADPNAPVYYWGVNEGPRRALAIRQTLDWIGDVPGAGSFGFSYVAIVLLALMVIVGPVDWFVLKWLGRQPWTWVTISGWIGLVTLGSIYIGHVFKSGDIHFRTASLIDEAGGARVAAVDFAGLYSPRTTYYDMEFAPSGWWRTASASNLYGGSGLLTAVDCHQDYRGNRPLPLLINVWNVRFLEGEQIGDEPSIIQAQLTRAAGDGRKLTGTLTNRATVPLNDILLRTRDGVARIDGVIDPGATMPIDATIRTDKSLYAATQMTQQEQWSMYQQDLPTTRPTPQTIGGVADLRSARIDQQLLERDDVACVYATFESPPAGRLKLNDVEDAKEAHVGIVRAVVPLLQQ